jgi:hypothetical protein
MPLRNKSRINRIKVFHEELKKTCFSKLYKISKNVSANPIEISKKIFPVNKGKAQPVIHTKFDQFPFNRLKKKDIEDKISVLKLSSHLVLWCAKHFSPLTVESRKIDMHVSYFRISITYYVLF